MLGIDYSSSDEEKAVPFTRLELVDSVITLAPPPETVPSSAPLKSPSVVSKSLNDLSDGPTVLPPPAEEDSVAYVPPGSPFTASRVMIQNLTLPAIPNFDIPPSPHGSPPQKVTTKFAQFLELKKSGQHFNQRLEHSSVLRDPDHLEKLMEFAGISKEDMYMSTLPQDLAVPIAYPNWAYAEELRATQKRIVKAREQGRSKGSREAIDFVPATKSGVSSGASTFSGKGQKQSMAEGAVTDTNREYSSHSCSQSTIKRKQFEHRGRDSASSSRNLKSRSRSPKRCSQSID